MSQTRMMRNKGQEDRPNGQLGLRASNRIATAASTVSTQGSGEGALYVAGRTEDAPCVVDRRLVEQG